jgi:NADH:ubiquinone oxidoreductase subunit 4 (subunit M)
MFRFLFQSFGFVGLELMFIILVIGLLGLLYGSLAALNQIDFKKIVAYSSVAHMNFLLIGLFSQSLIGLAGAFFSIFSHAFTSAAFFFCLGVLYDRYKTRLLFYYGGFTVLMPLLSVILFLICLANFGFPGTFNFVGEFLILAGMFESSIVILFCVAISLI